MEVTTSFEGQALAARGVALIGSKTPVRHAGFAISVVSSAVRTICPVLALAAALAATDLASGQPFDPVPHDIRTGVYRGHVVTYEVIDGLAIWDGDIILGTPEELSPENAAAPGNALDSSNKIATVSSKEKLWPGGIVPYVIDPDIEHTHVLDAIRHWEQKTHIRLVERTDQPNWVRFVPGRGCLSHVGMIGGEQRIVLSENCGTGAAVHEIGHAVGLWHEHQRNDRDPHVWVTSCGLDPYAANYAKIGPRALDSGPYDYGSVMHTYWVGPVETIPPGIEIGKGGPQLGMSTDRGLSAGDIDGISRLYGRIPAKTTVTANVEGLQIEVDGQTYTAPHSFDWEPGSIHTVGVASPQKDVRGSDDIRYLFAKWSDGGAQSHSVTASSETTVFIANFIEQWRPEPIAEPPYGGTVRFDPPSADGFYPRLSFIRAFAEPAEGFSFARWRPTFLPIGGGYSSNPVLFRVVQRYSALFTQQPLTTIDTNAPGSRTLVDGSSTNLPASFVWEAGSTHTLETDADQWVLAATPSREGWPLNLFYPVVFNEWSDGGGATHVITVSEDPTTITATFTGQFAVQTDSYGPGTVVVQPSGSEGSRAIRTQHDFYAMVQLTAQPAPGFKFVSWIGDLSGTENPQSLLMDNSKWVRAYFLDEHTFDSAKLTSGKPFNLLSGPGAARAEGYNGYWIDVPPGATQLDIRLVTTTPGAEVDLYANRDIRPSAVFDENTKELVGYKSQHSATGPGGNEKITITPASNPPLEPGPYFIAVHVRTQGVRANRTLTAEVTASESEIAARVPTFGIPASLITAIEGETPSPQSLEVRNSGRGTLDYQITADQTWLSVWPDQGSSAGETDTVEITVDPANLEPGTYEGAITITEQPPAEGFSGLFSKSTPPAWPGTVPVTLIVIPESLKSPPPDISTFTEDGRPAVEARLHGPNDVAVDAAGNLFIADSGHNQIRRVEPSGIITVIAGIGEKGYAGDGGPAIDARLFYPASVTVDAAGSVFIAEYFNHSIRKVDPYGTITTIAGTGERGFSGDGGQAVEAQLAFPSGLAVDADGNLFIADYGNQRIRRVDGSGTISTFAGGGDASGDGGPAIETQLKSPEGVTVDAIGNLYIAVLTNSTIRRVDPSGTITTIAGVGRWGFSGDGGPAAQAHLSAPSDVAVDAAGNLFIVDRGNERIRKVDTSGTITTIAGTGERGFSGDGGPAVEAQLDNPRGVAVDADGNLYIADHGNHRIRKVDPSGTITTVAGTGEI